MCLFKTKMLPKKNESEIFTKNSKAHQHLENCKNRSLRTTNAFEFECLIDFT